MSLFSSWPARGGLPEPVGDARAERDQKLVALVNEKLAAGINETSAPIDVRIENFLSDYLAEVRDTPVKFPSMFSLYKYGMARTLSLPHDSDKYDDPLMKSWRCQNGVLHNPVNDKRTTAGVFHVAEGGYPIAEDKKAVPKVAFSRLLDSALNPPEQYLRLPYTANDASPKTSWVRLLVRPLVCPEVPGYCAERRMEVRMMAPGSMVANVDFVESVFGNFGDAHLPENDAALDTDHWTGHTGCIILAPHLLKLKKKDLGLPHWDEATDRQKRDTMAWKSEDEVYNNGGAFKICARTSRGVFVTMIADNYFGYCKKEVKTQLSFASNLFGTEEEHAGGALAFASLSWGKEFHEDSRVLRPNHHYDGAAPLKRYSFADAMKLLGDKVKLQPEGYAVDREYPDIVYIPEGSTASLTSGKVTWSDGETFLVPGNIYVHPSGYQISIKKRLDKTGWHICGTVAEPMNCHKPSTVSGGGKSEISKLLSDMITFGTVRIDNVKRDLAYVDMIFKRDYSDRYKVPRGPELKLLDPKRTLGSVVKLLTASTEYTDEYNSWLETIPSMIRSLVFLVKHHYQPSWGSDWRSHFAVDSVDGRQGDVVYVDKQRAVAQYLRIGRMADKRHRKFQLRYDFVPANKIQTEDDISASVIVPRSALSSLSDEISNPSVKLLKNCELRLFQRPDDAIIRGCDTKCEEDMSGVGSFMSNFEPLTGQDADILTKQAVQFDHFTAPMQDCLRQAAEGPKDKYVVSSNHFRIVNGKPTANPRYLQVRTDFGDLRAYHVAHVAACLRRQIPVTSPAHFPVNGVLPGRRNNPPDTLADGTPIRPLAVYNPLHYQELPELFMDFVCSLTGKSPSTTGAGSEGALTKGPFNALLYTADLNSTLVGWILCGYSGFSSAAGYIGNLKVDHDISLLVPEIWCRMSEKERDPAYLVSTGCLEKVDDMEVNGQLVHASRLGYRITERFAHRYLGRIFNSPYEVFDEAMLKPETQDFGMFVDGINNITEAQAKSAKAYIADGSVKEACPPLRAVLYCMAEGVTPEGHTIHAPEVRKLFTRENLLASDWYKERLCTKQRMEKTRLGQNVKSLQEFLREPANKADAERLRVAEKLKAAEAELAKVSGAGYLESLVGTSGAEPALEGIESQRASA